MTSMYMYMLSCHACRFWWFPWGVSKNTVLGGVSKMVVFGGGPKKGHFWPPRGAQNFLHPPPGKPRQNIYYLDTRHPPGGGRFGGGFRTPPWTVVAGVCFGAIFAPPRRGAKTGILTSPVSRSPSGHTMCCKKVFMYIRDVCSSSWHENIFCVLRKYFTHSSHRRSRRFDESVKYFFIHMKNNIYENRIPTRRPRWWSCCGRSTIL
jgi:hypothetical protein